LTRPPIRTAGPSSATRTRRAAKAASGGPLVPPLVPRRQATARHRSPSGRASAPTASVAARARAAGWSGGGPAGAARTTATSAGNTFWLDARDAHGPGKTARAQALAEGGADAAAGVGQPGTEAHASGDDPVEFGQRQLRLGLEGAVLDRHAGPAQALGGARPRLGQEQPRREGDRGLIPGQGERDQGLAVGVLAERRGVLRRDAHRGGALLRRRRAVDDEVGVRPAHQPVRLDQRLGSQRSTIPAPGRDEEVVQAAVAAQAEAPRHRLHALALARADQARHVGRAGTWPGAPDEQAAPGTNGPSHCSRSARQPASCSAVAPLLVTSTGEEPRPKQPVPVRVPK
jgi:hypothetical protein